ncbi:hypothetical protein QUF72_04910 [Desulfobacterales bacterium HSG2]|nr:hypothetical protein [Desulfobacterales bacterium HSG2]
MKSELVSVASGKVMTPVNERRFAALPPMIKVLTDFVVLYNFRRFGKRRGRGEPRRFGRDSASSVTSAVKTPDSDHKNR